MASYSDVEICNLALIRCGGAVIGSLSEDSEQARTLRKIYPMLRDSVLQKADWNFARKELPLGPTDGSFAGWDYTYQYPADCVEMRYLYNPYAQAGALPFPTSLYQNLRSSVQNIPFEVRTTSDGNSKVIVTNQPQAIGIYTRQVTNSGLFSPLFVDAFAARLAAELACTILINSGVHNQEMSKFIAFIAEAQAASSSEEGTDAYTANPIVDSRL